MDEKPRNEPTCEQAFGGAADPGECDVEADFTVSTQAVGTTLPTGANSLVSQNGVTLAAAAKSTTIWVVDWSQTYVGLFHLWEEKQTGRAYYDKHGNVWATTQRGVYKGTHFCGQGYAIGYSINVTSCLEERRPDLANSSGTPISEGDYFQVHTVAKGVPIYISYNLFVNIFPNGAVHAYKP